MIVAAHGWNGHWYYVFYLFFVYKITAVLWRFWWKAPMIVDSETLLYNAYNSSNGKPFAMPMVDRWIIFVTDREELRQLELETESLLSLKHALHELGSTTPILGYLAFVPENKKSMSETFRIMISVLKNKLRSNLPEVTNAFQERVKNSIAWEFENGTCQKDNEEWRKIRLMPAFLRTFTRVNLLAFLGEEQANKPKVCKLIMDFYWSCGRALPLLNLMPAWILPIIAPVIVGWGIARARVYRLLHWITHQTLSEARGHINQWITELSKLNDVAETAKVAIGLLFASAFQVPMVVQSMIHSICKHTEYHSKLHEEALKYKDSVFGRLNQDMPLLDSFMRETVRLSPGIVLSAPCTVMSPYTSPQGYTVPTGNWLVIPQLSLMRDSKIRPNALDFDSFRFLNEDGSWKDRLTHPEYDFPFCGSLRHAYPAPFYVSDIMKLILSRLITNYEFKLEDETRKPFMTFEHMRLPSPFLSILIRKRVVEECTGTGESVRD